MILCPGRGKWKQFVQMEVPDGERAELNRHASSCDFCREQLAEEHKFLVASDTPQVYQTVTVLPEEYVQ